MTKSFNTIGDVQKQGIEFGEAWVFTGFPEPLTEKDNLEKWEKEWTKAEDAYAKIENAVAAFLEKSSLKEERNQQSRKCGVIQCNH